MGEGEVPVPCGVDPVLGSCSTDTELSHEWTEEGRFKSLRKVEPQWLSGGCGWVF